MNFILSILFLAIFITLWIHVLSCPALVSKKRMICYFASWATRRAPPANIQPEDFDPCLCTNVLYSFAAIKSGRLSLTDLDRSLFQRMLKWRQINPNIKISISVGGWTEGSANFNLIIVSDTNRQIFCQSVIDTCRAVDLDGIDIDWEYPMTSQRDQYTAFMQKCHDLFVQEASFSRRSRLLLSAATAPDSRIEAYDIPALNRLLDFIMPMTYDIHGSWDGNSAHHSPLYGADGADPALRRYINAGMSPDKLNIGLASYGRATSSPGPYTQEGGILAYYEICTLLCGSWRETYDNVIQAPKAQNSAGFGHVFYDNQKSMITKANYVLSQNIGGAFIWDTSLDDFNGQFCCQGKFPLISAVINTFAGNSTTITSCCGSPSSYAPVATTTTSTSTTSSTTTTTRSTTTTTVFKIDYKKCPLTGAQFAPHPTDCVKFIVCSYSSVNMSYSLTISQCATGLSFNPISRLCDGSNPDCSSPSTTPSPIDYSKCPVIGQQFAAYPGDCSKFLLCTKSTDTGSLVISIAQCSTGLLFNKLANKCDRRENVDCNSDVTNSQVTTKVTTNTVSSALVDYTKCPLIGEQFAAYPGDCSKFIVCTQSETGNMIINVAQCAVGLVYNPKSKLCDFEMNVNCYKSSTASSFSTTTTTTTLMTTPKIPTGIDYSKCPVIGEQYSPYPGDCTKFLMCSKTPNSDTLIVTIAQCAAGLLYNPTLKVCDYASNVQCTSSRLIQKPFYGNLFD